jgi:nitroreductase
MSTRQPTYPIDPPFLDRWSPRAFDGSPIREDDVLKLIEAARWAPSAFNIQPWRFLYALRDDAKWPLFLELLVPFNQSWASSASALIFILSDRKMRNEDGSPREASYSHSFDAGAAWAQLALQARRDGLYAHGMSGFNVEQAIAKLGVPDDFRIEAAVAVGRLGNPATLPDYLREREQPSVRTPLDQIAFAGSFRAAG